MYIITKKELGLKNEVIVDSDNFIHDWDNNRYFLPPGYSLFISDSAINDEIKIEYNDLLKIITKYSKREFPIGDNDIIVIFEDDLIEKYNRESFLEKFLNKGNKL